MKVSPVLGNRYFFHIFGHKNLGPGSTSLRDEGGKNEGGARSIIDDGNPKLKNIPQENMVEEGSSGFVCLGCFKKKNTQS